MTLVSFVVHKKEGSLPPPTVSSKKNPPISGNQLRGWGRALNESVIRRVFEYRVSPATNCWRAFRVKATSSITSVFLCNSGEETRAAVFAGCWLKFFSPISSDLFLTTTDAVFSVSSQRTKRRRSWSENGSNSASSAPAAHPETGPVFELGQGSKASGKCVR